MFRILHYCILFITIGMTGFYISRYQPELVNRIILTVDIFNLSALARNEHERVERIRALDIPYSEKQVLMNRTVFMQASPEMVKLALGDPMPGPASHISQERKATLVYYVYYLGDDIRPTILVFENNKLAQAYKGSALDMPAPQ